MTPNSHALEQLATPAERGLRPRRFARGPISPGPIKWALGLALASGCFRPDDGREPPLDRIYFPTGLALSPDGNRLYVANSDWDLQFNAGSVQVYDAAQIRERLPSHCDSDADCASPGQRCQVDPWVDPEGRARAPSHWCVDDPAAPPCGELGVRPAADRFFEPGLCGPLDNQAENLLLDSVSVGAFATDLIYRSNPRGGGRLFVPVRSDATLHWIDVRGDAADGLRELDCGQDGRGECDANHRRGDDRGEWSPEGDALPIEPFGIAATTDGTAIVTTHQTEREVSLFVNDWSSPELGPVLTHVLGGLSARPIQVAAIPVPEAARTDRSGGERRLGYQPGFWVTFRGNPFVELLRFVDAADSTDGRPYLERAPFADLLDATSASDVRSIAVDASQRERCESGCGGRQSCLEECASVPLDLYLANRDTIRNPAALIVAASTSTRSGVLPDDRIIVSDVVAVDSGPTRAVAGSVKNAAGEAVRRVFLTSFDGRSLSIYDPAARRLEARVLTGRGPTAVAIDERNALAYVAHFTDSYVGVVDLDQRHDSYGTMLLTIGTPVPPRGDR